MKLHQLWRMLCGSVDSSLVFCQRKCESLTGPRISFLSYSFLISLTMFGLFCYQLPLFDQVKPWFRFPKRTSSVAWLDLCLVAFTRTTSVNTRMADRAAIELDRGVKSEVGNRKSEIGSWKSEVGRPSSAFVVLTSMSPKSGIKVKDRFLPFPI